MLPLRLSCRRLSSASALRASLLSSGLSHVPSLGWGPCSLVAATSDLGLPPSAHTLALPPASLAPLAGGGRAPLVHHHMAQCNTKLRELREELLPSWQAQALPDSDRRAHLLRSRLLMNGPFVLAGNWDEAMAVGALPPQAGETATHLGEMLAVVQGAGGALSPLEAHAERAALGAAYVASELFMLSDGSEGFEDTGRFLDERLRELDALAAAAPGGGGGG
ncbi:hypothetical protein TeGR_g537, partial [Tetraparma gracilis]